MKFGSVCSGVEAASLAWLPLGWECKFVSEIEPFPCAVLQHRFGASAPINQLDPNEIIITDEEWALIDELKKVNKDWMKACDNADLISRFKERKQREAWIKDNSLLNKEGKIPNEGDFTKIGKKYAGQIDLLVGGTPCQDLSIAGKRAGFDGERSSLALDFVRLVYESQCKWFVWENVPGVFSSNEGRDFATLLSLFTGSKVEVPKDGWGTAGFVCNARRDRYGVAWRTLDGQFTRTQRFPFAVPQRRRRVFLIGYFGDWTRAAEVLLEPGRSKWDTPSRFKAREIFAEIARADSALADGALRGTESGSTDRHGDAGGVNPTLNQCNAGSGTPGASNQELFAQNFNGLVTNLCESGKVNATFWNGNDVAECLKANCDRDRMPDKGKLPCVIERNEVAATLTASYADKMGLENQHIDQGAPNFIISAYNGAGDESGEITPTLRANLGKLLSNQTPVICLNDQGGSVMSVESDGNAGTLRANTHGNEQIVCGDLVQTLKIRSGCEGGGKGALVQDELSATLGCGNDQTLFVVHGAQTPEVISMHNKQFGQCEENIASTLLSTDYKEPQIVCYDNQTRARNPMPTGDVSCTMQAAMGEGGNNVPLVQCFDARGNGDGSVSPTATGDHLNRITDFTPVVHECYAVDKRNQTLDAEISNTLNTCTGGDNYGTIMQECYAIDSMGSNAMKSSNPYSGFHKEEIAKTLDTTDPNPTKNQGGNVIVDAVAIAENIIGRAVHNGGNGVGAQEEVAYTQNATGVMGVCQSTVRRLLPIECERLMGFPDNHTRIPWKCLKEEDCPDSPRYKACGNSMCVNVMQWIGEQIDKVEKRK
jgi:DNA (cytosine-5)-methyltransferase 1